MAPREATGTFPDQFLTFNSDDDDDDDDDDEIDADYSHFIFDDSDGNGDGNGDDDDNNDDDELDMLKKEHDALVLEHVDTRKVLEETRRELSQQLYRNDAAIRVLARISQERDAAKKQFNRRKRKYSWSEHADDARLFCVGLALLLLLWVRVFYLKNNAFILFDDYLSFQFEENLNPTMETFGSSLEDVLTINISWLELGLSVLTLWDKTVLTNCFFLNALNNNPPFFCFSFVPVTDMNAYVWMMELENRKQRISMMLWNYQHQAVTS